MSSLRVANAPCSFGAFELTLDHRERPDPTTVLDAVAAAGYDGIDLGPPGYLAGGNSLRETLDAKQLGVAGGFLSLPFGAGDTHTELLPEVDELLDLLERAAGDPVPRPTIADAGSPERFARPGQAQHDAKLGLGERGWSRFSENLTRVTERCRERGLEPTFHPHAGTFVEAAWEIEKLLESTDVGLCFDSGHLAVGGIDPLIALREWAPRINHLHLKDVDLSALEETISAGDPLDRMVQRRVFCAFGVGDIALGELCEALAVQEYDGWLVVEQDIFPTADSTDRAVQDQNSNREFLREFGL